jgi:quinol monooxygenase YgiN
MLASWYAVKLGPSKFGIFDTFANQAGRDAHLTGPIAKALMAKAEELLAEPPQIEMLDILASKTPGV